MEPEAPVLPRDRGFSYEARTPNEDNIIGTVALRALDAKKKPRH
jgi:hypothetical protein